MRNSVLRWGAAVSWAGVLIWLGSRPPDELPDTGEIYLGDKIAHAGAYGILGLLVAWAARPANIRTAALWGCLAALLVGGTDEWLQSLSADRDGSLADLAADLVGGTTAALAAMWVFPRRKG